MGRLSQPQLLAYLAGVALAAGALSTLPFPANISYALDESGCILSVRWDPAKLPPGHSCQLQYYYTALFQGETEMESLWSQNLSRKMAVPLRKNLSFGLRTTCEENDEGKLFKIPLEQNGTEGTGATNVSCLCHNMEYMACSWKRGRQAPRNTDYHLSFWYGDLEERHLCTNRSINGDTFRCVFPIKCFGERTLVLSIRSDSEDIQPACVHTKEGTEKSERRKGIPARGLPEPVQTPSSPPPAATKEPKGAYPIKLHPPSNLKILPGDNVIFLMWKAPSSWNGICYIVEINGVQKEPSEDSINVTIALEPKKYHTLRVKAVLGIMGSHCKKTRGLWSEWSEPVHWDDREKFELLSIILFITIPLCAAILTIIFLVYLKRIQLLIFPIIPDPEKVLKRMFEDQREEYMPVEYPSEFVKPDTIKADYRMS